MFLVSPVSMNWKVNQTDSMLPCVCSVIDQRWRQNVVKTEKWHASRWRVCHWYTSLLTINVTDLLWKVTTDRKKSKENWGDFFLPRFHFPSRRSLATFLFSKRSINQSIIYFSTLRRGAQKTPSKYERV